MCQTEKAQSSLFRGTERGGRGARMPDRRFGPAGVSKEDPLICRRCGQLITSSTQRISVAGAHEHTFSNPDGIMFHIGCFGHVQGCLFSGELISQWSWFKGYQWQVTYCSECGLHLGWRFSSGEHVFHGLVLRNISRLS